MTLGISYNRIHWEHFIVIYIYIWLIYMYIYNWLVYICIYTLKKLTMVRNVYNKNCWSKLLPFQNLLLVYQSNSETVPRGLSHTASLWLFILLFLLQSIPYSLWADWELLKSWRPNACLNLTGDFNIRCILLVTFQDHSAPYHNMGIIL